MKKLLIVDGNSIINRAFYAIRPLTTSTGLHTNAIFGMVNILTKHIDTVRPDYCAVAFDLRAPTFRHKMYADYKAGRRAMPEELAMQFDPAKQCVSALGFSVLSSEGYEADDILGTLSAEARDAGGIECYIVTGDRDALQLIDATTTVLLETNKGTVRFDAEHFTEEYGVTPDSFIDVKALMGDSSDNIPGVAGIGEKTALKLIAEYGSVERLYEELPNASFTPAMRAKLEAGHESAKMSRELATIFRAVPNMPQIDQLGNGQINAALASEIFTMLEFSGFIKRFGLDTAVRAATDNENIDVVNIDAAKLSEIKSDVVAFDIVDGAAYIYDGKTAFSFSGDLSQIGKLLDGRQIICHDCKKIYEILSDFDVTWRGCAFDVMLASYVVNSGDSSFELPRLAMEYLGVTINDTVPAAVYIYRLEPALRKAVADSGQDKLLYEIEMPLAAVLADMELSGFKIDCAGIENYGERLGTVAGELAERIYYHAGGDFNINSPKQLGEVLFERLGLPCDKKTKTGYSTSAEILNKLRPYHPIVEDILDYRQVTKLKSTYVDGLLKLADENACVHTHFKQTGTATGRLSSVEPNLQNIPVRTELGRELRRYFIPKKEGYVLIDADYSQIELRLLAAISGDECMTQAFLSGEDIHTSTAATVFNVELDDVTSELRKRAKAVNFGIMYGIGEYSLSQDLGISVAQAKRYIADYLASYPAIDAYLKGTIKQAYEDGYVTTIFGRRRYITELKSQKRPLRAFGERVAMNSPIQGSAADIIKIAMINVDRRLRESGIDAHLILQVHDELLIESHRDCADEALDILRTEMEGAISLSVPMDVDISCGDTWFECK
ncbi:MAG: DNA polymerase I [Clostridia bacterium]|nr:DNA polymerase I [Clostridia bacterium]